jgi:hypothetical protein
MLPKFDLVKMWLWLAAFVGGIRRAVGIAAMNALADTLRRLIPLSSVGSTRTNRATIRVRARSVSNRAARPKSSARAFR